MQNGRIYLLHSLVYTSNSRRIKYNLQIHRISISTRRKIIVKMINEIGPSPPIAPMRKKKLNNINSSIKDIYVSDMPTLERQNLCNLLNEQTKIWETLAAEMQFTTKDIRVCNLGFTLFLKLILNVLILGNTHDKATDVYARTGNSASNLGRSNQSHCHRAFCSTGQVLTMVIF